MQSTRTLGKVAARPSRVAFRGAPRWVSPALTLGSVTSDALLIWLATWLAYLVRYKAEVGGPIHSLVDRPFETFYPAGGVFVGLALAVFLVRGLYSLPRWVGYLDEASMLVGGLTTSMAGVILGAYFFGFFPSRLLFVYAWAFAGGLLLAKRGGVVWARHRLWRRGIGVQRVLVAGGGETGRRLMQALASQASLGSRMVGYLDDRAGEPSRPVATERRVLRAERLGTLADLPEVVRSAPIDEVMIALPAEDAAQVRGLVEQCRSAGVPFKVVPDLFQLSLDRVDLGQVAGVPLIGFHDATIGGWRFAAKRTADVLVALTVLAVGALPMALIALAIRRDTPGPVLVRQERVGRNGAPFTVTKFRTMVLDAEARRAAIIAATEGADPRLFKRRDDPRLTATGRWLRRWSLDELPQFFEVLRGEMSVVGPRPPLPEEVAHYEEWHRQRLLVTPGLTGLWQVNGRSGLTFDEMVRLDLFYAEHWSPWLDVKIVLRTLPAVLTGRGAC